MRVLMLALPRTGTSTLLYRIAEQGFDKISEPYNRPLHKNKYPWPLRWDSYKTDIAVKHLIFSDNSNLRPVNLEIIKIFLTTSIPFKSSFGFGSVNPNF